MDKKAYTEFVRKLSMKDRDLYISWVSNIRRFMASGNDNEVKTRSKWLVQAGFLPPVTIQECDQMMNDLREFHV